MKRVVNASGVVVHTNLGRSVLAPSAVEAAIDASRAYSTLEYNVDEMARGSRHDHYEKLICALTGAEAAIAVNNNAAAVMMVLSEFARGHEAVVSRGELVEIGGSFRIPDIMELSGARMVEIGTTNKTHPSDYERAINDQTAMLLKVHTSNYQLVGFSESVPVRELRRIADAATAARRKECPEAMPVLVYNDLGSGALVPFEGFGNVDEHPVERFLEAECDLVTFSGDKLLGGPQAGIIVGRKELVDRLKKNPLARALRLDKMTIAALEATLRLYLNPELAIEEIPTLRMLFADESLVKKTAKRLSKLIEKSIPNERAKVDVISEISRAGGGALPMCDIQTWCVRVRFEQDEAQACNEFLVRENPVPIIARLSKDALLFDARTLLGEEDELDIAAALKAYFETPQE